jgi:hypothetical protein
VAVVPVAMGLKLALDATAALLLTREELATGGPLCPPCLVACACSLIAAPLGVPETLEALRHLQPVWAGGAPSTATLA